MNAQQIRPESSRDCHQIRSVLTEAFPTDAEAKLVDRLRLQAEPYLSLVAEQAPGNIIGHILFTPVEIRASGSQSQPSVRALGLGPMAVRVNHQRQGVGSALIEAGFAAARSIDHSLVVVLGHPAYYPRFGFTPAWDHGLYYLHPAPNPAFMVRELEPGALENQRGAVVYHAAFNDL